MVWHGVVWLVTLRCGVWCYEVLWRVGVRRGAGRCSVLWWCVVWCGVLWCVVVRCGVLLVGPSLSKTHVRLLRVGCACSSPLSTSCRRNVLCWGGLCVCRVGLGLCPGPGCGIGRKSGGRHPLTPIAACRHWCVLVHISSSSSSAASRSAGLMNCTLPSPSVNMHLFWFSVVKMSVAVAMISGMS